MADPGPRCIDTTPLALLDALYESVLIFDEQQRLLWLNAAAAELFKPGQALVGSPLSTLPWVLLDATGAALPTDAHPVIRALHEQHAMGPERLVARLGGLAHRWLSVRAQPVMLPTTESTDAPAGSALGAMRGIVMACNDITPQVAAETRLRVSERERIDQTSMLERLVDSSPGVVHSFRLAPDGTRQFVFVSAGAQTVLGLPANALMDGQATIGPHIHPDDVAGFTQAMQRSARELSPLQLTFRYLYPTDGSPRWIELRSIPEADGDGGVTWHGFLMEVTDERDNRAQIELLNQRLEQRVTERTCELEGKTRELESFTYSVSHDLKAPLRGIDGYSRLLLQDHTHQLNDEGRGFVQTIRTATLQMSRLIDDLLAYSKVERSRPLLTPLSLRQCVDEALAERQAELAAPDVELSVDVGPERVIAEHAGLLLVLRNLLDNALKFTRGQSSRRITVATRDEGERVVLWVQDNGLGFDMRYHDRIFEIFQRLQRAEDYPGTGVGLAIVRKAMERQHGAAWAQSVPGQGATFFVALQRAVSATEGSPC